MESNEGQDTLKDIRLDHLTCWRDEVAPIGCAVS